MRRTLGLTIALCALSSVALASDHEHEGRHEGKEHKERHEESDEHEREERPVKATRATPADPQSEALYRKECGSCHLAFPPRLLSAASHQRILGGLEDHFGQNAELDAAVRARLEAWLVANAAGGAGQKVGDAPLRITGLPWFEREHRKVTPRVVARASVRSRANCAACHPGAAGWDFDEDRAKIPAE